MQYKDQKKMAFVQIFLGCFIIGYSAVKYIKSGFNPDSVNFPIFIAIGILLPLSSLFGLRRVKAQEERLRLLNEEKEPAQS